jgi:vitamin B12 transporter
VSRPSAILASRMVLAVLPLLLAHRIDPASAADSNALAEPVALPTVVVTPTRLPTPESEVGSSITVITDEEIQRKQERTLPDALKDVPGLMSFRPAGREEPPPSLSAAQTRTRPRSLSTASTRPIRPPELLISSMS